MHSAFRGHVWIKTPKGNYILLAACVWIRPGSQACTETIPNMKVFYWPEQLALETGNHQNTQDLQHTSIYVEHSSFNRISDTCDKTCQNQRSSAVPLRNV